MKTTTRLFTTAGLIAISQLLVIAIGSEMAPSVADLPSVGNETLPKLLGEFSGRHEPIDERLVRAADAAVMFNHVYQNNLGDRVIANVGLWTYYQVQIPHTPDLCYPGAGWDVAGRESMQVLIEDGRIFEGQFYVFQKDLTRVAVLYWAHINDQVVTKDEAVREVRQKLRLTGEPLPVLVKVMLQTDAFDIPAARRA